MVMEATHSAQSVGREFVRQYYTLLNQAPTHLHRFYNHNSSFIHGGLNNTDRDILPAIGQKEIHQKIQQLNFRDCHTRISQVDSQATLDDGVVIQVTGEFSNAGEPMRRFTQTFVLASRAPKMYFVLNDIFRYQDLGFPDEEEELETDNNTLCEPVERAETEEGRSETEEDDQGHPNQNVQDQGHSVHLTGQTVTLPQPPQPIYYPPATQQVHPMQPVINGNIHEETPLITQQRQQILPQSPPAQQYVEPAQPEQFTQEPEVPTKVDQQQPQTPLQQQPQPPQQQPSLQSSPQQPQSPAQPVPPQSQPPLPPQSLPPQSPQQPPQQPPQQSPPQQPPQQPAQLEDESRVPEESNEQQASESLQQSTTETESEQIIAAAANNRQKSYAKTVRSNTMGGSCTLMPKTSVSPPPVTNIRNEERPMDMWNPSNTNMNSNALSSGPQHRVGSNQTPQQRSRVGPVQKDNRGGRRDWPDNHQLFVGNVPHHATESELRVIFERFGKVVDLRIFSKGSERGKGLQSQYNSMRVPHYGFVTFEDAAVVAKVLSTCPICYPGEPGQKLNIEEKKNKPRVPGDNNMRSNQDNMRSSMGVQQQQQQQRGPGGPGFLRGGGQHARGGRGIGRASMRQPGNMSNPGYQNRR